MKLPIPTLFGKKDTSSYYLTLLLRDEKTIAVILQEEGGKLRIVGRSESPLPSSLEKIPFEELLELLDSTISKAEETLPPNIETEKTVFGVKDTWVEEKKIKKEYLSTLKKLCDALSLQPIGFMVISEAIAHLLSKDEGAPLSGVLAEINKTHVTLTLFRAGKVVEAHTAQIEDSLPKTVDRLLHHFTIDVLPSRIIVFNGGKTEELSQEFISHQWSKSIPFLHVPQISVLPEGFDGKAMIFGASEQMGYTILDSLGDVAPLTLNPSSESKNTEDATEKKEENDEEDQKPEDEDEDSPEKGQKEHGGDTDKEETIQADNFGFVVGQDISTVMPHKKPQGEDKDESLLPRDSRDESESDHNQPMKINSHREKSENDNSILQKILLLITTVLSSIPIRNPLGSMASLPFGKNMLIVPIVLIVLIGGTLWYYLTLSVDVTLHMQARQIEDDTEVVLQVDSSNDLSQRILAAKEIETSLEGTVSVNTTGKKEVGEKAKGTITLYNNSESRRTIPAGTILTSSNDLDFVTDKEVIVASESGDVFSGTKPGTVDVGVTAKNIGTEYNLPSNTTFKVAGTSTLAGKNASAFSGGSKKEVRVVAKKDIDTLTSDLSKNLESKAREALRNKATSERALLPIFTDVNITKKSLDYDLGEEANKVTMKGTVTFATLEYATSDLKQLAEATLKGQYTQDLAISDKGIEAVLKDIKTSDDEVTAQLVMNAGLLPKLDKDQIITEISGKSLTDTVSYLKEIPQVKSADIVFSPNIPFIPKFMPRDASHITIELTSDE